MRVSMSAIGSVSIWSCLRGQFDHHRLFVMPESRRRARARAGRSGIARLAEDGPRPAAVVAARVRRIRALVRAFASRGARSWPLRILLSAAKAAQRAQERAGVLVRLRRGRDGDVEAGIARRCRSRSRGRRSACERRARSSRAVERLGVEPGSRGCGAERSRPVCRGLRDSAPRSVARAPTAMPLRSLKLAIDLRAFGACAAGRRLS